MAQCTRRRRLCVSADLEPGMRAGRRLLSPVSGPRLGKLGGVAPPTAPGGAHVAPAAVLGPTRDPCWERARQLRPLVGRVNTAR